MKISDGILTNGAFDNRLSLTGADEELCAALHLLLCYRAPINELTWLYSQLQQMLPHEVEDAAVALSSPAVLPADYRGIFSMRRPAPETAIPEVKASPAGLRYVSGMDHRLGAWK